MLRRVFLYRLPALLYAAALFWASSKPRLPLPRFGLGFEDKIAHFAAFAILSWLVYVALTQPRQLVGNPQVWTIILCALYALSDEWHQRSVPGRTFDWLDLAADLAGILAMQALLNWRSRRRVRSQGAA